MLVFNERLKNLREQHGLTQIELGRILNISNTTLNNYEKNVSSPSLETLVLIADFFETSTDYLLGVESPRQTANSGIERANKILSAMTEKRLAKALRILEELRDI